MQSNNNLKTNILKTICYADIFVYPLKIEEIHKWLITENNKYIPLKNIKNTVKGISSIKRADGYYYLKPRKIITVLRNKREKYSQEKLKIANRVGKWLRIIPTIKALAITGALAMKNSEKDDDIDLMIITSTNYLWLTRLLITPLISLIAKRRKPSYLRLQTSSYKDTICLNLWLDEKALLVPKDKQNLYTAHEVAQTKFLWSKDNIDEIFLTQNSWINKYLPNIKINNKPTNSFCRKAVERQASNKKQEKKLLSFFEFLAFIIQLSYMKTKKTREIVTPHSAFFHPRDTGKLVLKKYQQKLNKYSIN